MPRDSVRIKLSDQSEIDVKDCGFDLLLNVLYRNDFDLGRVSKEIDYICTNLAESSQLQKLLKKCLQDFASELSNKITMQSITEGIAHQKIVEDLIVAASKIQFTIAETPNDMRKILHLRKRIFVDEEGYPPTAITNGYERDSLHVMAITNGELVACASIVFDGPQGLPLEKHVYLKEAKEGLKVVEVDKLAVVGNKRKRELAFNLMWLCYSICRFWGAQRMFIFTLSKKEDNLLLYSKFGFKKTGEFEIFANTMATALMLDFNDLDTYEKKLNTTELLRLGKKLLDKFSLNQPQKSK